MLPNNTLANIPIASDKSIPVATETTIPVTTGESIPVTIGTPIQVVPNTSPTQTLVPSTKIGVISTPPTANNDVAFNSNAVTPSVKRKGNGVNLQTNTVKNPSDVKFGISINKYDLTPIGSPIAVTSQNVAPQTVNGDVLTLNDTNARIYDANKQAFSPSLDNVTPPLLAEQPTSQPDLQPDLQSDLQPDIQTDLQPDIQTDLQPDLQQGAQPLLQNGQPTQSVATSAPITFGITISPYNIAPKVNDNQTNDQQQQQPQANGPQSASGATVGEANAVNDSFNLISDAIAIATVAVGGKKRSSRKKRSVKKKPGKKSRP
jgi:hypothetical protein